MASIRGNKRSGNIHFNTANKIVNRFIPVSTSQQFYRVISKPNFANQGESPSSVFENAIGGPVEILEERDHSAPFIVRMRNGEATPRLLRVTSSERISFDETDSNSIPTSRHDFIVDSSIAEALGFSQRLRVLQYLEDKDENQFWNIPSVELLNKYLPTPLSPLKIRDPEILEPNRLLQSHGLQDDFYLNLVSWSKKNGCIIIGLLNRALIWSKSGDILPLKFTFHELIYLVSFSNDNYIALSTERGGLMLFDHKTRECLIAKFDNGIIIQCFCWLSDSSGFFAGGITGEVVFYKISESNECIKLFEVCSIRFHKQQICGKNSPSFLTLRKILTIEGMSISNDSSQIAIGSNDNRCSVWDIVNKRTPVLKFVLPHTAAVKAVAYCPWSDNLLATGGGIRDKKVRFWHTNTGTLLKAFNANAQVTSLVWCRNRRQIAATFGYSDHKPPVILEVYSYPKMEILKKAFGNNRNSRALSGVLSPNCDEICIASSSQELIFYTIWAFSDHDLNLDLQQTGIFGSQLIELVEQVFRIPDSAR